MSAILFIPYLACCSERGRIHKNNENGYKPKICRRYFTYLTNDKDAMNQIKENIPKLLKKLNLQVNESKTEHYEIPKPPPLKPPPPTMKELLKHKNDKPLWSALDWLTNYKPPPPKDKTPNYKNCKITREFARYHIRHQST